MRQIVTPLPDGTVRIEDSTSMPITDRNSEIANLEWRVVCAAEKYVQGVGYDASSLAAESQATEQFVNNYNAFMEATRALLAARAKAEEE